MYTLIIYRFFANANTFYFFCPLSRRGRRSVITQGSFSYIVKNVLRGTPMKEYIEERAVAIANYIIDCNATVRQTAKKFGISKSTVHIEVIK